MKRIRLKKIISILEHVTFAIGGGLGLYAFADIYFLKKSLPEGACPVITNRPLLYTAIALIILSVILSFVKEKRINHSVYEK